MLEETKILMQRIDDFEKRSQERHERWEQKQEQIHNALMRLPCAVHVEKMNGFEFRLNAMGWILGIILVGGIVFGIWLKA
jgi:hypothetical protein